MIIVEGMDNSGKTTLVSLLKVRFNLPIIKRMKTGADGPSFLWETLTLMTMRPNVIFDRHPVISENIYGTVLRGQNALDTLSIPYIHWMIWLRDINPMIIYCRPPNKVILDFSKRTHLGGVEREKVRLLKNYDHLMSHMRLSGFIIIDWDYTKDSLRNIFFAVNSYLDAKYGREAIL